MSEVWYLRHPKSDDNLPEDQRIWSINKSRSRCSGKFMISYDPDDCVIVYHGDFKCTPQGQGSLEGRLLDHFQQSPGIAFEIAELALQFSCSEAHMCRLVKRLWRQGHITEGIREVEANNGRGGKSRKKMFTYPEADDQVTEAQSGQGLVSGDRKSPLSDQVTQTTVYQGLRLPDHHIAQTRDANGNHPTRDFKEGDWVELLTGCFTGRQVQVVGFPRKKPGWVEVKGKAWLITKEYQRQDLRLIRRVTA